MNTITAMDIRNQLVNSLVEFSALMNAKAETVADGNKKAFDAVSSLQDKVEELNELTIFEYCHQHTFSEVLLAQYIPVFSIVVDHETNTVELSDEAVKKVTMKAISHFLPINASEKAEALGRISAYFFACENSSIYDNPMAFISEKVNPRTGKPSKREAKVQEFIKSYQNKAGGFSIKDMKMHMHNFICEISHKDVNMFFTSELYREFCAFSVKRGANWGERTAQSSSVYEDMVLEFVYMVLSGKKQLSVK